MLIAFYLKASLKKIICSLWILEVISFHFAYSREPLESKVIIAGITKNNEFAVENTIRNIEQLGSNFKEYAVIIYENNSSDQTPKLYAAWASKNTRVDFISEILPLEELNLRRPARIAYSRNKVLERAKQDKYSDFDYLIFVDLDFTCPWPIRQVVETIAGPGDWDCVSANGVRSRNGSYWDRYAYRGKDFPLGPELIGDAFWDWLWDSEDEWFTLTSSKWIPVYSAFGGLAIYKMQSIRPFWYSGTPTEDLKKYYKYIISLSPDNHQIRKYLEINTINLENDILDDVPIVFVHIDCCEHLTLHASMALNGYGKFFINPELFLKYTD